MFESTFKHLLSVVEGAESICLLSLEGIVVEGLDAQGRMVARGGAMTEFAQTFAQLDGLKVELGLTVTKGDLGEGDEWTFADQDAAGERHQVFARRISPGYLLLLRTGGKAIPGQARFHLRVAAPDVAREL